MRGYLSCSVSESTECFGAQMHHYQRTVLRGITLLILAASFVLLILQARQQRYPLSDADSFLCTTKTVTSVPGRDPTFKVNFSDIERSDPY